MLFLTLILVVVGVFVALVIYLGRSNRPTLVAQIVPEVPPIPTRPASVVKVGDQVYLPFARSRRIGRIMAIRGRRVTLTVTHRSNRSSLVCRKMHEISKV